MDEGEGESSSPARPLGGPSPRDALRNEIYERLLDSGNEEVISNPNLRDLLDAHLSRLPLRYGLDLNMESVEDVLLHQKILADAEDPDKRPIFHVRFMKVQKCIRTGACEGDVQQQSVRIDSNGKGYSDIVHEGDMVPNLRDRGIEFEPCSKLEDLNLDVKDIAQEIRDSKEVHSMRHDIKDVPIHEIIFSSIDKPKLLSQVNYDYLINITKGFSLSGSIWGTLFYIIRISSRDDYGPGEPDYNDHQNLVQTFFGFILWVRGGLYTAQCWVGMYHVDCTRLSSILNLGPLSFPISSLSALLADIGLNIREAHVFSTTDGYSLDVFEVDGWPEEETDGLLKELDAAAIAYNEGSLSGASRCSSTEKVLGSQSKVVDWEIDRRFLKMGKKIARGSCGDLYRATYLGQDVAVKILRADQLNEALLLEFNQEVDILRRVHHKNIVHYLGACVKPTELCIITEYMTGGNLYDHLHKEHISLELPHLLKFSIDICKGMDYLHQNNIIHRDLKTANLLLDANSVVKVGDFGVARFQNQEGVMTAETGTYRWMAPEVINHQHYDNKADVFSFAIVLWELATSRVPYDNMTPLQAALGVRQGLRPDIPKDMHPRLAALMQRCWDEVPSKRPSFEEITQELEELLHQVQVCLLFVWFAPMGLLSKGSISLVILILFLVSCCDGSRTMHAWYQNPAGKKTSGGFFEFLPRAMPIPPSGPSKRHNSIGLHGQTTP
ncbi:unnamed protein product [Musa hybrid cultivar]